MGYKESVKYIAKSLDIKNCSFLVTGATGLIGTCIIDVLISANEFYDAGIKIYALSRSKEKIQNKFGNKVIPLAQDICDKINVDIDFNYIIHTASNADPVSYAKYPVETITTNIIGCKNVLDYCASHLDTKLLFTSTFEVYGKIKDVDVYSEETFGIIDPFILRNGYSESKKCAEMLLHSYVDEYGVNAVIARLPSVYGPTMAVNDSKAHAQFINNALVGENIILKSEGKPKRTYCYVIDAVSAIFTILFNGETNQIYNISNENSIATIAEVAHTCAKIANTKVIFDLPSNIEAKGFSKPQNCILDNTKLKKLGWSGLYNLHDGIKETIETLKVK